MNNLQRIAAVDAALDSLERCLKEYTCGWANRQATDEIAAFVSEVRRHTAELPATGYFNEKLVAFEGYIVILFSARKHQKHGGAERVKADAIRELSKVRAFLHRADVREGVQE